MTMMMGASSENKNLKYNHVAPIELDSIPVEELERALIEFSEGSLGLEICLRVMWANGLKTHACCAGEDSDDDIAYVAMEKDVDIFAFLSDDLLLNEMVVLENEGRQSIHLAGTISEKDALFQQISEDILTGVKANDVLVQRKIGKFFPDEWLRERRIRTMRRSGLSDEEIAYRERGLEINKILEYGTAEEQAAVMPEFLERVQQINKKLEERAEARKVK